MVRISEETRARRDQIQQPVLQAYESIGGRAGGGFDLNGIWIAMNMRDLKETGISQKTYWNLRSKGMSTGQILGSPDDVLADEQHSGSELVAGLIRALALKEEANNLFKRADYAAALDKYQLAITRILRSDAIRVPTQSYFFDPYLDLGIQPDSGPLGRDSNDLATNALIELVDLASHVAECYSKMDKLVNAIDWIYEVEQMLACARFTTTEFVQPAWKDAHPTYADYWIVKFETWLRAVAIFQKLGNTGVAACFGQFAMADYGSVNQDTLKNHAPRLYQVHKQLDPKKWAGRHPEPNISQREIRYPELQVMGAWQRQQYAPASSKPCGRMQASTWIWSGSLYVAGGGTDRGGPAGLDDFWSLSLSTRIWRRLDDIPLSKLGRHADEPGVTGGIRIWKEKAYCFVGKLKIAVFDLVSEQWVVVQTTMPRGRPWPYDSNGNRVASFATTIMDGVLYVFGGKDGNCLLGNNIFMALDLETMRWTHISGTSKHVMPKFEPELRTDPAMWAVPSQSKVYILYGAALRSAAGLNNAPHGSQNDYTHTDFWSYDVAEKRWAREKLRGSHAAWRTEMAHAFAPALGRVVVFGGYNGSLMTINDQTRSLPSGEPESLFQFCYFGDTVLFDPQTRLWQHVLVKGFPSYRAFASVACDPADGKIYVFGGYTNAEFVPSNRVLVKMYNDLWQLKVDLPGGNWDPKDLERDIRLERAGPWRRCFECGVCGITWQKCGGTCGGKYFFCSKDCQKAGWKEHKEVHGCRKKT